MDRSTRWFATAAHANSARLFAFCFVIIHCALCAGCSQHRRACMPKGLLASETTIDLGSTGEIDHARDRELLSASLSRLKAGRDQVDPQAKKYNVLALSGGGSYGAF